MMRLSGYLHLTRALTASLLRWLQRGPVWLAVLVGAAADVADPDMPESILRPREWLPRIWSRWHQRDANLPPR